MSTQVGTVQKTKNGWAWVETRRQGCCGHKSYSQMIDGMDRMVVKARNHGDAGVGDEVELYLASKTKLKGLFLIYMLPVTGLLLGALSAPLLAGLMRINTNVGLGLFTIFGFLAGVFVARHFAQKEASRKGWSPVLRKVLRRSGNREILSPKKIPTTCSSCSGCR